MPAQTPIDRQSLGTTLEERYATQHVGGAYDARQAGPEQPIDFGQQDKVFESPSTFKTDNFNTKALNFADSLGLDTRKYKP